MSNTHSEGPIPSGIVIGTVGDDGAISYGVRPPSPPPGLFSAQTDDDVYSLLDQGADPFQIVESRNPCSYFLRLDRVAPATAYLSKVGLPEDTQAAITLGRLKLTYRMNLLVRHFMQTGNASLAGALSANDVREAEHSPVRVVDHETVLSVCFGAVLVRWRFDGRDLVPERWVDSCENSIGWIETTSDAAVVFLAAVPSGVLGLDLIRMKPERLASIVASVPWGNAGCTELRASRGGALAAIGRYPGRLVVSHDGQSFELANLPDEQVASVAWVENDPIIATMASEDGELFDVTIRRVHGRDYAASLWQHHIRGAAQISALSVSPEGDRLAVVSMFDGQRTYATGLAQGRLAVLGTATGSILQEGEVTFQSQGPGHAVPRHSQVVCFARDSIAVLDQRGVRLFSADRSVLLPLPARANSLDGTADRLVASTVAGLHEVAV